MKKPWGVFHMESGDLHVAPIDDTFVHRMEFDCECEPAFTEENGHLIYTHKAYDFREVYEWIREQSQ